MGIFSSVILAFGLWSFQAGAVIKITGVAGASGSNISTTGVSPIIYGGMAGTGQLSACTSTTETCDGCALATSAMTCNRARVSANVVLRITFTSDAASGRPGIVKTGSTVPVIPLDPGSVTKGSPATIRVNWGTLCAIMTEPVATCETTNLTNNSVELSIGIDSNGDGALGTGDDLTPLSVRVLNPDPGGSAAGALNEIDDCAANASLPSPKPGFCGFLAYPGDKKIFVEEPREGGPGFPAAITGNIDRLRFYYKTDNFSGFSPASTPYKEIPVETGTGGSEFTDTIISGLENGVPTFFRFSSVDVAGNEMFFTSDASIVANCTSLTPSAPFDGTSGGTLCPFAAVPDEVLGLLTEDLNCFIATAAFGSRVHPVVDRLREFRNRFLLPHKIGRNFINWYYLWSPGAARWLKSNETFRTVVRWALIPVWLMVEALIWWPISATVVLLSLGFWQRRRWRIARG